MILTLLVVLVAITFGATAAAFGVPLAASIAVGGAVGLAILIYMSIEIY